MTFQSLRQYLKGQTVYLFHFHTFLSSFLLPIFHVTCTVLWVQATETAPVIWGIFIAWAWVLTKPLERVEEIGLWVLLTKLLGSRWCGIAAAIHMSGNCCCLHCPPSPHGFSWWVQHCQLLYLPEPLSAHKAPEELVPISLLPPNLIGIYLMGRS